MDIPMQAVVDSYRQQLSDVLHKATIQELHINALKEALADRDSKIKDLQNIIAVYEPTAVDTKEDFD